MNIPKLILEGLDTRIALEARIEDVGLILDAIGTSLTSSDVEEKSNPGQRKWIISGTIARQAVREALGDFVVRDGFSRGQKNKFMDWLENETGIEIQRDEVFAVPKTRLEDVVIEVILRR